MCVYVCKWELENVVELSVLSSPSIYVFRTAVPNRWNRAPLMNQSRVRVVELHALILLRAHPQNELLSGSRVGSAVARS